MWDTSIPVAMLQLERPTQAALLLRWQKPMCRGVSEICHSTLISTWLNLDVRSRPFHMLRSTSTSRQGKARSDELLPRHAYSLVVLHYLLCIFPTSYTRPIPLSSHHHHHHQITRCTPLHDPGYFNLLRSFPIFWREGKRSNDGPRMGAAVWRRSSEASLD